MNNWKFLIGLLTILSLAACQKGSDDSDTPVTNPNPVDPGPIASDFEPDIDVQRISRTPRLNFVKGSTNPTRDGWPQEGQEVFWNARVKVYGGYTFKEVHYSWFLDGVKVKAGIADLGPESTTYFKLPWSWQFQRKELRFVIEYGGDVQEVTSLNNELATYTDALSVGFGVTPVVYDYFKETQQEYQRASNSFEDWAQIQVKKWNEIFENAIYPETPNGVIDRVRLDTIWLDEGIGGQKFQIDPMRYDQTVDLTYFFIEAGPYTSLEVYQDKQRSYALGEPNIYDGVLFHEVGHGRYLIDVYAFDIQPNFGDLIDIHVNGIRLNETEYFPPYPSKAFQTPEKGLMNGNHSFLDRFSAIALNRRAGERAITNNFHTADAEGLAFAVAPAKNTFSFTDSNGIPISNAQVKVYYDHSEQGYYLNIFSDEYFFEAQTDDHGNALMPDGFVEYLEDYPFVTVAGQERDYKPTTFIIEIKKDNEIGFAFLESFRVTLAFWENAEEGQFEFKVDLKPF